MDFGFYSNMLTREDYYEEDAYDAGVHSAKFGLNP